MSRIAWVLIVQLFLSSNVFAVEPPQRLSSRFDTQLHLFSTHTVLQPTLHASSLQSDETQRGKKSAGLAAVYSLIVPGTGELYADGFNSGKYFMIAEGALWLTYTVFNVYGNALQDDARSLAVARAGINLQGKEDQFFIDIGNFMDINEYNEKQLRDREEEKLYDARAGYGWRWENDELRAQYRAQRIDAENMFNNRKFVVAAVIVNHVASAINAARSAISYNKALDETSELRFGASVLGGFSRPHGILFTVTRDF